MSSLSQIRADVSIFYETWESQAALDQHKATLHFQRLEHGAPELVKEPFQVDILKKILAAPGRRA
jgi:quinol monooxygenase YgiN